MGTYVIRRLLLIIPTMLVVTLVVFFAQRLIPGDIIDLMAEAQTTYRRVADRPAIERALGLDAPVYVQYGRWMGVVPQADGSLSGVLQGDLGVSLWKHTPVAEDIAGRLPVTVELGIFALLSSLIVSLPLGIYAAIRQDSIGDYMSRGVATGAIAMPSFWVGLMIILTASLWFGYSPPLSPIPFFEDPMGHLEQFIVPAIVLGMPGAGTNTRMMRSMMLEVLRQDYIRTAWAKGLREKVVVVRHALKNALIPVVTLVGIRMPVLVGGTVIIETVFSLPGMGLLLVNAVLDRDYTVVSGVLLIFASFMVLINLAVDLTYAYLDPRIHYK